MDKIGPYQHRPPCYGDLDSVFPQGPEGLREVPEPCTPCPVKVECLKSAINQGQGAQEIGRELASREQEQLGGVAGFVRRWSRLKSLKKREQP
jgi:hypothetical protein